MSKYKIIRIPTEEETQPLVVSKVYTTQIPPKLTANLLRFAASHLPCLEGIEHVKRVKKDLQTGQLQVVLAQCQSITKSELEQIIATHWDNGELEIQVDRVPGTVPRTPKQLSECTQLWPVSYRPSLLPQMSEIAVDSSDRKYIEECLETLDTVLVADPKSRNVRVNYHPIASKNPLDHSVMCCVAQVACQNKDTMYLCENLDVFVGFEPCVMCTMALVHSRIGRLFIRSQKRPAGGITRYHLHSRRALNHRFAAYRCLLD